MADTQNPTQPMLYHIRLQGKLDSGWGDRFGGVTVTLSDDGTTLLICEVIDQAALHGLLRQIRLGSNLWTRSIGRACERLWQIPLSLKVISVVLRAKRKTQ